jgi:hypothetical protein
MSYSLWVTPVPLETSALKSAEGPTPSKAGLREGLNYLVLDVHDNGTLDSEAYFSVVNEDGELWFVSNRHFRVVDVIDRQGISVAFIREPYSETPY